MQGRELCAQDAPPVGRDAIGIAAVIARQRLDESLSLEARDRTIKRAWTEPGPGHLHDIFDHGVPMLGSIGEAGQHQQRRVRVVTEIGILVRAYYVPSTSCHVVTIARDALIAQAPCLCEEPVPGDEIYGRLLRFARNDNGARNAVSTPLEDRPRTAQAGQARACVLR